MTAPRPLSVLIAAMGGEGGGVLASWLVAAASAHDLPVQGTSIPGLAQRTGATTYYIEIFPIDRGQLGGRAPVFALYPIGGTVDLVIASELIEAGRAVQNGYVTPDCTTLIASTHRVFAIEERAAMGDGRASSERVLAAAQEMAKHSVLTDLRRAAAESGGAMNAVMLGAIAGSGVLPIPEGRFADAIRAADIAVESNLAGFEAGLKLAKRSPSNAAVDASERITAAAPTQRPLVKLMDRIDNEFPAAVREVLRLGVTRAATFQDFRYGRRFLDRLAPIVLLEASGDNRVLLETARHLALRMTYEDVIRVAQIKADVSRLAAIRGEAGVGDNDRLIVTEFLKPGIEEFCALMPGVIAVPVLSWARRRGLTERLRLPLRVRSSGVAGFAVLRALASLRPLRRLGHRFAAEQRWIDTWLSAVARGFEISPELAFQIAACARLVKGYGETDQRGRGNYARIHDTLIAPAVRGLISPERAIAALSEARRAALADPSGAALNRALTIPEVATASAAE